MGFVSQKNGGQKYFTQHWQKYTGETHLKHTVKHIYTVTSFSILKAAIVLFLN